MADLIIRGMEMPGCCGDCQFQASRWTGDFCSAGQFMFGIDFDYRDKHPKCPLVPLPEGHGRLGDLDKLETTVIDAIEKGFNAVDILLDIRFAPTIVPAEGGGEDCWDEKETGR